MINGRRYAFTLIELITVMAITAILMTIITLPMIETFKATRVAQAYSDAQDKARILTERLSKEIGEAVAVRDVEGLGGRVSVVCPIPVRGLDDTGALVTSPPGGFVKIGMNYTKLDLVLPQKVGQRGPSGAFINPSTGREDPTLKSAEGQVQLPIGPGATIKRYWIGLNDPFRNYNNLYDGLLMTAGGGRDNLFVLYSAEVQPIRMVENPPASGNFIPQVNTDFFDAVPDGTNRNPIYDDSDFFLATGAATGAPVNNDAKAIRINNWKRVAKVETEVSRYDLIQPQFDKAKKLAKMSFSGGLWAPRVTPLVLFRPSHVEGDGADAQVAASLGNETEGSDQIGSEVFQGQFRMWSNLTVRTYGLNWQSTDPYQIARRDPTDLSIYFVQPGVTGVSDTTPGSGTELFNISAYERAFNRRGYDAPSKYPFNVGLDAANVNSGWLTSANPAFRSNFMPFSTNTTTGKVIASFNIGEVGDYTINPSAPGNVFDPADVNPLNLPQVPAQSTSVSGWTSNDKGFTPSFDPLLPPPTVPPAPPAPQILPGVFSDTPYWDSTFNRFNINRVFNKVWLDAQAGLNGIPAQYGETGGAHRFVDLRTIPQGDGTVSPLSQFGRARIVPGSEEVFGPDQSAGSNFGYEIRYHRVNREPGPNEYRINYADLTPPTAAGWAALGLPVPPAIYDRTSFVSAIIEPRYKAGYIQLCSNPEVPIPAVMIFSGTSTVVPGRIRVAYKFQFTTPDDVVRAEYDTRQLMQVIMTIRNYPQSDLPYAQTVTMKATANVRNFIR